MARSRSLPTSLFDDPDFFEQSCETRMILMGLVLLADDSGRGPAHPDLLARKLNTTAPLVEEALQALEKSRMLICYQVERHDYYALTHWLEWETLSKPTPSRFPAPPTQGAGVSVRTSSIRGVNAHADRSIAPFVEAGAGEPKGEESEQRSQESGDVVPDNVVAFPAFSAGDSGASVQAPKALREKTQQVASILKLPVDDALLRIVEEYGADPALSVLGEADAAREWIENPRRNQKGQRMSPAFFRRWLKREQETLQMRKEQQQRATGAMGYNTTKSEPRSTLNAPQGEAKPAAVDQYAEYIQRREREVHEAWLATQTATLEEGDQVCSG